MREGEPPGVTTAATRPGYRPATALLSPRGRAPSARSGVVVQQRAHRARRRQPRTADRQIVEADSWQRRGERPRDVLEIDEGDEIGLLRVPGDLGERQDDDLDAGPGELLQRLEEVAAVAARDEEPTEPTARGPGADVHEHVGVDVVVRAQLRAGEDVVAEGPDRLDPAAHGYRAAGGHVGEHRALDLTVAGIGQQPSRHRVEAGPRRGRGTAADHVRQRHVDVRCVPDEQIQLGSLR